MDSLNLGVRAHDFGELPLPQLITKIQEYSFTNIQFAIKKSFPTLVPEFSSLSPGLASYFGNAFQQAGIKISVLGCYVNIASSNEEVRKQAVADFKTHLRLARDFGASLVGTETGTVGSAGYTPDNFKENAFQLALSSIREMVSEAEKFGVTVGIEPGINHPLYNVARIKRLLNEIPSNNLQLIFDAANLMTPENIHSQETVVDESLNTFGDRIAVFHLKDCQITAQNKKEFAPLGQGQIDFRPIINYMKHERPLIHGLLDEIAEPHLQESIAFLKRTYAEL